MILHAVCPTRGACSGAAIQRGNDGLQRPIKRLAHRFGGVCTEYGVRNGCDRRDRCDQTSARHGIDRKRARALANNRAAHHRISFCDQRDHTKMDDHRDHDPAAISLRGDVNSKGDAI